MKSSHLIFLIGFMSTLFVTVNSCSKDEVTNLPGNNDVYQVTIQGMRFQPDTLYALPGHTITWKNLDAVDHTVVSDDGITFNSGTINPGGSYSFTTNNNFIYPYHCGIHPGEHGVLGVVIR
ncbi:MAG: cupredoxin domain-containing protein [Panacibacter sp.]